MLSSGLKRIAAQMDRPVFPAVSFSWEREQLSNGNE
jgi:hypothetical protein